jgi:acyl carrier protein
MTAALGDREHSRREQTGISLLSPEQALAALDRLFFTDRTQLTVLPVDWRVASRQWQAGAEPPLFADLVRTPAASTVSPSRGADLRTLVAQAVPSERRSLVLARVRREATQVLGIDPSDPLDPRQPLNDAGLDSLMAVELRNALGAAVGQTLPATLLFRYPNVDALTGFLLRDVLKADEPEAAADRSAASDDDPKEEAKVAELQDDEVKRLLAEELAELSSADWMRER